MRLAQQDAGSRRAVRVGEDVVVALPENPTTGYRWHAEVDAAALRQADDRFEGATTPRGAGGLRVITFQPLRPGEALLRLVRRRSWEVQAGEEYVVRLEVLPG